MPSKKEKDSCSAISCKSFRIVVLGSSAVGKSAIVMQYVRGVFIESYDPTLEDSFSKRVQLNSRSDPIDVEILDTAGTDQFAAMRDMYIGSGDAFLLVYAVDSKASFNEACSLYDRIKTIRGKKCNVMLVGNKSDLASKYRRVTYEQGTHFSYQNRCSFMEVSARKNDGIVEAFEQLIKLCISTANPSGLTRRAFSNPHKNQNNKNYEFSDKKKKEKDCIIM